MRTRWVGDTAVSAIGYGAMPLSDTGHPDAAQARRTIHAALDAGCRLIDTADAYAPDERMGHNERIVGAALRHWGGPREEVLVATKVGHIRPGGRWDLDGRPEHVRQACDASLRALGVDVIGLYQYHRPDPKVPFVETVGELRSLQEVGKVRYVGLSNVSCAQIREALGVVEVAAVQNEFSPRFRGSQDELELCATRSIAFLPWSPLGGTSQAETLAARHPAFAAVAAECGVSAQRVALAWELAKAPVVIPIPGASRPETILDSLAATELHLSADQLARLDAEA
jgi:aryl-alcohol dehydrogenase-like predicted oxidoreductase